MNYFTRTFIEKINSMAYTTIIIMGENTTSIIANITIINITIFKIIYIIRVFFNNIII